MVTSREIILILSLMPHNAHSPSTATKKPYLNNRKTSVRIFLLDIPKTKARIKTDHLRPKEYHSMLAIFFKASLHILFLSYLTRNVVNSYMNNRDLECSWVVGEGGQRGVFPSFTTFGGGWWMVAGGWGRCRLQATRPDVFKARSSRIMLRQEFISMWLTDLMLVAVTWFVFKGFDSLLRVRKDGVVVKCRLLTWYVWGTGKTCLR